jgi:hypothetical protein
VQYTKLKIHFLLTRSLPPTLDCLISLHTSGSHSPISMCIHVPSIPHCPCRLLSHVRCRFDGALARCKGFLLQCDLYLARNTRLSPGETGSPMSSLHWPDGPWIGVLQSGKWADQRSRPASASSSSSALRLIIRWRVERGVSLYSDYTRDLGPPRQQLLFLGSSKIIAVYTILKKLQYIQTVCPKAHTPPLPHINIIVCCIVCVYAPMFVLLHSPRCSIRCIFISLFYEILLLAWVTFGI